MDIVCACVIAVTLLFTLSHWLSGFSPVLITIRRGNESPENRRREFQRDGTHFLP
jgi:hypothetical protein